MSDFLPMWVVYCVLELCLTLSVDWPGILKPQLGRGSVGP